MDMRMHQCGMRRVKMGSFDKSYMSSSLSAAIRSISTDNQYESERSNFSVHTTMQVVMKQHWRLTETALTVNG